MKRQLPDKLELFWLTGVIKVQALMWCISFSTAAIGRSSNHRCIPHLSPHQYHGRSCLHPWWTPSLAGSRLDTGYPAPQLSGHPLPFSLAKTSLCLTVLYLHISRAWRAEGTNASKRGWKRVYWFIWKAHSNKRTSADFSTSCGSDQRETS